MNVHDLEHLRKLQKIHRDRLNELELQSARFGVSVPAHILVEINEIKNKIASIDDDLSHSRQISMPLMENELLSTVDDLERRILVRIRNVLALLYENDSAARRVVYEAGLSDSGISFSGSALQIWHGIIRDAQNQRKVAALLLVALGEYEDNNELHTIWREFQIHISQS